jgi:hypothetical protein
METAAVPMAPSLVATGTRRPVMDLEQLVGAIPEINNFSTVASIVCVLPTYVLRLQPASYRLVLSLGIVCGLATWVLAVATIFWPLPHQFDRAVIIFPVVFFSPLVVVLITILARIRRVSRVGLWSTVVLACVILDWVGISLLVLALS